MSDNWIIVIPETPDYVPSFDARRKAVDFFRSIAPRADDVKEEATDEIRFIDCGANFERIICPNCKAELDVDWWQQKMDEESDAKFPLRLFGLPCCGSQHSLDQLKYEWPQGFARFSIEAMNPGIPDLNDEHLMAFESILGCRIRKVLQHI